MNTTDTRRHTGVGRLNGSYWVVDSGTSGPGGAGAGTESLDPRYRRAGYTLVSEGLPGLVLQDGYKAQGHGHTHDPHEPRKEQI